LFLSPISRFAPTDSFIDFTPPHRLSLWRSHLPPNKDFNSEFGRKIKELREARKKTDPSFSLRQFANAVGISPTFLSKVENGESTPPSAENIQKMAALLECDADELLALAGRFDPALESIIAEQPKAMADLLRTAKFVGATAEDLEKLRRHLLKRKNAE
jgi:transcriptional regulator with XRE-family HTH domain